MLDSLKNKRILLGISGGITVYNTPEIIRRLLNAGAQVKTIVSPEAVNYVSKTTLEMVSGNTVYDDILPVDGNFDLPAVSLSAWADAVAVVPANADFIARLSAGMAGDLLMSLLLLFDGPVLITPSLMQPEFNHPSVQTNLSILEQRGIHIKPPGNKPAEEKSLSPFEIDFEPADIVAWIAEKLYIASPELSGISVLVTAGPTVEEIDPVRYISNRSSGKMGFAIASELAMRDAAVTLVHGPVNIPVPGNLNAIGVKSAQEMFHAVQELFPRCRAAVMSAAVADYRPLIKSAVKIKKGEKLTLELTRNPDILTWMGEHKQSRFVTGFALEDEENIAEARRKLNAKNADVIVLNTTGALDADVNKITLVGRDFEESLPVMSKPAAARVIVDLISRNINKKVR